MANSIDSGTGNGRSKVKPFLQTKKRSGLYIRHNVKALKEFDLGLEGVRETTSGLGQYNTLAILM